MGFVLLIVLILLLAGIMPSWQYSQNWGYRPSGVVSLLLAVLVVMIFMDVVHFSHF